MSRQHSIKWDRIDVSWSYCLDGWGCQCTNGNVFDFTEQKCLQGI